MKVIETELPGVLIVEPQIFRDDRGYFYETWHKMRHGATELPDTYVQDNVSYSVGGVLPGCTISIRRPRENSFRSFLGKSTTWLWISASAPRTSAAGLV